MTCPKITDCSEYEEYNGAELSGKCSLFFEVPFCSSLICFAELQPFVSAPATGRSSSRGTLASLLAWPLLELGTETLDMIIHEV